MEMISLAKSLSFVVLLQWSDACEHFEGLSYLIGPKGSDKNCVPIYYNMLVK